MPMTQEELLKIIEQARVEKRSALHLQNAGLTTLPAEIGQLKGLTELNLSRNGLTTLPAEIGQLKGLTELDLSGNGLATLPAEIGQLKGLTKLYLSGNGLTTLPAELGKVTKLTLLYLHGNERLGIPAEVLGPTWEEVAYKSKKAAVPADILRHYFGPAGEAQLPLNEAMILVVGQGGVGKTSLI